MERQLCRVRFADLLSQLVLLPNRTSESQWSAERTLRLLCRFVGSALRTSCSSSFRSRIGYPKANGARCGPYDSLPNAAWILGLPNRRVRRDAPFLDDNEMKRCVMTHPTFLHSCAKRRLDFFAS
jgi:hypothetical protein